MKTQHEAALRKFYDHFAQGAYEAAAQVATETMTFQIAGKSKLAGKYTRESFAKDFGTKLRELGGAGFKLEVHDILASDLHGTVMLTYKVPREGKTVELRSVHVWRFEGGKPLAGYEYPRDLYQYDAIWG